MGGSVIQDKRDGKWHISIYWEGMRYRIFKNPLTDEPFYHKKSALRQLTKIQGEIDRGVFNPKSWLPNSPLSTDVYAESWLKTLDVTKKTLTGYKTAVSKYISVFFKNKDIRNIRFNDINQFKKWLPLSEKGKYNTMGVLKKLLRDAWKNGDLEKVPPFPRLSFDEPEIEYLSMEQQEQQLKAMPVRHRPIFMFMMEYGLRIQEGRALQKDCVVDGVVTIKRVFSENELRETTKTGSKGKRKFELTEYAKQILDSNTPTLSPFAFTRDDGKPYTNKNLNKIWKDASKKTGIECKLYNAVRHSAGCQLLDQGEDIDLVRELLGHTKIEMTRRYAKRKSAKITQALEKRRNLIRLDRKKTGNKK